jgi:electron transfer flavoprotein alpha subunit
VSGVLVYSEKDELGQDLLSWAVSHKELGDATGVVIGEASTKRAEAYRGFGAARIYHNSSPALATLQEDRLAPTLAEMARRVEASLVLIGATRRGRALAPRLAQLLGAGCVSEAVGLEFDKGHLVTGRYSLGGNTIAREVIRTPVQVIAVAAGTIERATPAGGKSELIVFESPLGPSRVTIVERRGKPAVETNIAESDRLVCVGRGLASKDDLPLVMDLAHALGGELACTRPLSYEYGWLPEDRMIGISGQKCSPQLLLSIGVSGQVQHTVGIQGARTIVAINTEKGAPIFAQADYAVVGDLYQVVPRLTARLQSRSSSGS